MGLNSSEEIGNVIAQSINTGEQIKQDVIPAEIINSLLIAPNDGIKVTLSVVGNYKNYPTDAFIIDHAVYCDLDSATLKLDEGYLSTSSAVWTYTS